jgi:hypothetical protein
VVPFTPLIGNNFILMDDNARPHIARVVNEFLDEVGINRIEWRPRSPDLNPIEHVWDMIGKKVKARIPSSATLDEVFPVLQEKWDLLDDQAIMNVVESMPRRMEAVKRARGANSNANSKHCSNYAIFHKINIFLKTYFYHFSLKSYLLCLMFCLLDIIWQRIT